ncbi:hypothetical protein GUITHDRAFT_146139 [Guillardia theta CCMP2712]|uniref:ATP-grasp domain-containing protein n=1 Tax=Guillardia theta (strain CCMP2712) TaxID=905079 RepID=L1IIS2_GUITC|nr:hypothetical protein GUITHDRAFT_146139 [Guillardia theta CCMP2712]EKX35997.1 hypothetical protein GUITHDRAFT_146139 [Guillardia theta CCMP2712]|eukprot:XP_005822977.1 hypothetical protein GUITHDRAFT_146139 [Guillardia theta CCMP2712]
MRLAIVGGGALAARLAMSAKESSVCSAVLMLVQSSNSALSRAADVVTAGDSTSPSAILEFCQANKADIAVVLPWKALAGGAVELLESSGIRALAPKKRVAELEDDRSLAKRALPSDIPKFATFSSSDGLEAFIDSLGGRCAVKPVIKSSGKEERVCASRSECLDYCRALLGEGQAVLVEQLVEGQEFSLLTLSDGESCLHVPPVQVYRRCYVGDSGPMVSGVGCVGGENLSLPFLEPRDLEEAKRKNEEALKAIREMTGEAYKGPLCITYVANVNRVCAIDLHANFGMFETVAMLSRSKFDIAALFSSLLDGKLSSFKAEFEASAVVVKCIFPFGLLLDNVREDSGKLLGTGSCAAVLVGTGSSIPSAEKECEAAVRRIPGSVFHRPDVGTSSSIAMRTESQRKLRQIKIGVAKNR